jgi:hypothetical protein
MEVVGYPVEILMGKGPSGADAQKEKQEKVKECWWFCD